MKSFIIIDTQTILMLIIFYYFYSFQNKSMQYSHVAIPQNMNSMPQSSMKRYKVSGGGIIYGINQQNSAFLKKNQSFQMNSVNYSGQTISCAETFKRLKLTENLLRLIKNRSKIKKLKKSLIETKQNRQNDKLLKLNKSLQNDKSIQKQLKKKQEMEIKEKINKIKVTLALKKQKRQNQMKDQKDQSCRRYKTERRSINEIFEKIKESIKLLKVEKRNKVIQQQKNLKQKMRRYRQNKIKQVIISKSVSLGYFRQITFIKQEQIKQLMKKQKYTSLENPQNNKKLNQGKTETKKMSKDLYKQYIKNRATSLSTRKYLNNRAIIRSQQQY